MKFLDSNQQVPAFHELNRNAQMRSYGKVEEQEWHPFREFIPDHHLGFYTQLPYVVLATADKNQDFWVSLITSKPDEPLMSGDSKTMTFDGLDELAAYKDPVLEDIQNGDMIGMLGIDLNTRNRNRINGTVRFNSDGHLQLSTPLLSYGNCPQYITEYNMSFIDPQLRVQPVVQSSAVLNQAHMDIINDSTTVFTASGHQDTGIDASHRGGPKGFVHVVDDTTLMMPDFPGNHQLKTVGNIMANGKLGLWFSDFGDTTLQMTGEAMVLWCDSESGRQERDQLLGRAAARCPAAARFPDSFNWVVFKLKRVVERSSASSIAFRLKEDYIHLKVTKIEDETKDGSIKSFYLSSASGARLKRPLPGQYLPLFVRPSSQAYSRHRNGETLDRTYSISGFGTDDSGADYYRLSVKLQSQGEVSTYLHRQVVLGNVLLSREPQGHFVFSPDADASPDQRLRGDPRQSLLFLSAGVGLTPLVPMVHAALAASWRVVWVHTAKSPLSLTALNDEVTRLLALHPDSSRQLLHLSASDVDSLPRHGSNTTVAAGRLDGESLRRYLTQDAGLNLAATTVFACGPAGFMAAMKQALGGVVAELHSEAFGPSA